MAIYQISKITNRKGLQIDLPQLAGAELGWSVDARRLWIGNGTLAEGAPVVGNTEILTEFSDLFSLPSTYTYKGTAAGYVAQTGPTPGDPVEQSLQDWMDQWVSIKDFGAVGDGVTDDTAAINRAMFQIYCVAANPQVRRRIFFPAGVYVVSDSIMIPPYASLYGEGVQSSIIQLTQTSSAVAVARTADSLQQTGVNIGNGGARPPTQISISDMAFSSLSFTADVFRVDCTDGASINNVSFSGPLGQTELVDDSYDTAALRFSSTTGFPTADITFLDCETTGTTYAATTAASNTGVDYAISGVVIESSEIGTHYQGVVIGVGTPVLNGGPSGIRITNNEFVSVYAEGVIFGACSFNATGYNIFYDVGNHFQGYTSPYTAVIDIRADNNVSVGDLFQRTDQFARFASPGVAYPRITTNNTISIAFSGSSQITMGNYTRASGYRATLANNTLTATTIVNTLGIPVEIYADTIPAFKIDYTILRGTSYRTGTIMVASDSGTGDLRWDDWFIENKTTGVILSVSQTLTLVEIQFTSTSTGQPATFIYSINYLA